MAKYIITGAAGFVGRYLISHLQKHIPDAKILGLDRALKLSAPISYKQIDLLDKSSLEEVISTYQPDYLFHLASISSVKESWQNPQSCFQNNTGIMLNILEAIKEKSPHTRILSIGSSEEYGAVSKKEMPLKETMPLLPQNPYAVAKTSQEMLCRLYAESFNLNVIMTRSFNHIGPKQDERFVVPSFIAQLVAVSRGRQKELLVGNIDVARDFTDVRDVVAAYCLLMHQAAPGEVYNVSSGKAIKLKEIIAQAEDILNINAVIKEDPARLRQNETMLVIGDNNKIRQDLGWHPAYTLRKTIEDIINDQILGE